MSRIRADRIVDRAATGAPLFPNGAVVTGVASATSFSGNGANLTGVTATDVGTLTNLNVSGVGTFGGNVSIGGTLTYEDVTNVDSVGLITARSGVKVPDNQKIFLGTGDDLQIYHDDTNSFIVNQTGGLFIDNTLDDADIYIRSDNGSGGTATYLHASGGDGQLRLYHYGSLKFNTSATGVTVTGNVTDTSGNLRITPISAKSGNYTLVATDTGKTITRTGGNITVPSSMPAGMVVTIINNANSTMTIIKGTVGTLRSTDGSDTTKTLAAYGVATVLYVSANGNGIAYLTGTGLS